MLLPVELAHEPSHDEDVLKVDLHLENGRRLSQAGEVGEWDDDVERADVAVLEDDGQLQRRQRVRLDAQVAEPQVACGDTGTCGGGGGGGGGPARAACGGARTVVPPWGKVPGFGYVRLAGGRLRTARLRHSMAAALYGSACQRRRFARPIASEVDGVGVEVFDEAFELLADQVRDDLLEHDWARASAQ